jgi:hypothetical protein
MRQKLAGINGGEPPVRNCFHASCHKVWIYQDFLANPTAAMDAYYATQSNQSFSFGGIRRLVESLQSGEFPEKHPKNNAYFQKHPGLLWFGVAILIGAAKVCQLGLKLSNISAWHFGLFAAMLLVVSFLLTMLTQSVHQAIRSSVRHSDRQSGHQ